jgi:hypothetical protein
MHITAVDVRDYKRIEHVRIEPDATRHLLLIAGKNMAGKSSLLDALTVAFGGAKALPPDPVRHGAAGALITIDLDGDRGRFLLRRSVTPDGKQKLEIRGPDGVIKSPQTWLDKLVGDRFLDPLTFLSAPIAEQRRLLLGVAGVDTVPLDEERARLYSQRTIIGRDLTRARGEYERLPTPPAPPPAARPVSMVTAELADVEVQIRQISVLRTNLVSRKRNAAASASDVASLRQEIRRLTAQLAAAEEAEAEAVRLRTEAETAVSSNATDEHEQLLAERRTELQAEIGRAETVARWQASTEMTARRRAEAEHLITQTTAEVERMTAAITDIDTRKAEMLAAAAMPVDGLAFDDEGVRLGGVPFSQASQAERLRCALAVSMRLSPGIRDVWVRDGSLLDEDGLEILRQLAEANECRVWVERVGERDAGAIVIRDGVVAGP